MQSPSRKFALRISWHLCFLQVTPAWNEENSLRNCSSIRESFPAYIMKYTPARRGSHLERREFAQKLYLHPWKISLPVPRKLRLLQKSPSWKEENSLRKCSHNCENLPCLYKENYACYNRVPLGTKRIRLETAAPIVKKCPEYILKTILYTSESDFERRQFA